MEWTWKLIFIWGFILLSFSLTLQAANLALGGVVVVSSLWDSWIVPSLLTDGNTDSTYGHRSCVSTQYQNDPWFRVDLGGLYDISTVVIVRRTDCCPTELDGTEIRIGDSLENNGNNNSRCGVITVTSDVTMTFDCNQIRGRYVNFFLPGVNKRLVLCEVKVYDHFAGVNMARGGVAAQSSLFYAWTLASTVIDGNTHPIYYDGSCSSTKLENNPWWRVDLLAPYDILSVEVTRRSDCCIYELNGAEIRIGNSLENNGNNNPRCGVFSVTSAVTMNFNCSQMTGRYVNIFIPQGGYVQLCEVKVYATTSVTGVNVAPRGVATQSANPASAETAPSKAIEENTGQEAPQENCASVPPQDNPWWQLDLRSIYRISNVSITSICCSQNLTGAEIRIGLRNDTKNKRCAIIYIGDGNQKYNYNCGIMEGRFIHVVLPGLKKTLTICELKVYGTVLENVALRGVAFQSSTKLTGHEASKVIDGDMFSTCSITEDKPSQWVMVDLLVPCSVTVVQLAYSQDCCFSSDVQVDNTSCMVIPSSSQSLVTLDCGGIVGRYVTVMHPIIPPPLCEVEVYSTWKNPQNRHLQLRKPPHCDYCLFDSCSRDYILIRDEPKSWFEAQTYCRERFTDLATISNPNDMNRVVDKMNNDFNDFWIGLYGVDLTWRWSLSDKGYYGDGEAEFRNWGVGEPNAQRGIQHCAAMQHTGEWRDMDCDLPNYFLCFDGRNSTPETKIFVETAMNWTDARRYCMVHHTDLLSVRNQAENNEIQSMVPAEKLAWIGLFEDSWKWSDGSYSSFRYWSQGLVNNLGESPKCAYVYDKKWSIRSCDTKSMFLCYYFKKRSVMRISTDFDMSDPVIQQQILSQLEEQMKKKGISDFKIRWRMSGCVSRKDDSTNLKCVQPEGAGT
ncbi:uncharacterized protein LOC116706924 isoform X1 [Etheostoma spectabile]|uniref:uncharacterized protein LOC116706924 isoform X1 n=1 Tax=Etheostoma spectabile TaxID=54343 RepID=UPI0013AE89CE|nr:uncharacterized protein LOC116706924 isoform X1 [Etheostoma spectabile]